VRNQVDPFGETLQVDGRQREASGLINAVDQPAAIDRERGQILGEFLVRAVARRKLPLDINSVAFLEGAVRRRMPEILLG
jgi:hypothetical protein